MSDRTLTRILENISHVLGKRSKLMSQPTTQHENLSKFLSSHDHLKWLHDIERQSFYQVCLIFAHEYTHAVFKKLGSIVGSTVFQAWAQLDGRVEDEGCSSMRVEGCVQGGTVDEVRDICAWVFTVSQTLGSSVGSTVFQA